MRLHKLAILLAILCSLAQAQTTTTFTGTIKDLTNAAVSSGNVTFTLQPGADTTISGNARFTPQTVTCGINGSGLVKANDLTNPCVVTNNTALQPSGTSYKVQICPAFACTASVVTYALGGSVDITTLIPTPAQMPAYSLVDIFQNQTIGGNKIFTGNDIFTASSTLCVLNGAQVLDPTNSCGRTGSDWVGWFNSAVTALGSAGGAIHFKAGVYPPASTSPSFSVPLIITGDGAGIALGIRPTVLTLAPGVAGFQCLGAAQFSRISDLYVLSQSTVLGSDSGVLAQCHAFHLSDVIFDGFGNRGVDTSAVTASGQNTNNWVYTNVRAINSKGDGFYFSGDNANLGTCLNCDASNNAGWGFNENGLAGNTFINPHVNANTAGGYRETSASNRWFNAYCEGAATFTLTGSTNNNHVDSIVFAPCTLSDAGSNNEIHYNVSTNYGTDFFNLLPKPGATSPTVYSFSSGSFSNSWFAMADQTNSQNIVAYEPGAKIWHFTSPVSMVADNATIGGAGVNINAATGATSPHQYQWNSGSFNNSWLALSDLTVSQNIVAYDPASKIWNWLSTLGGIGWARAGVSTLLISPTAPTIAAAGCGGAAASIPNHNGTAAFEVNVGTTPTSSCTVTMPAAAHNWAGCTANDVTNPTTGGGYNVKLTGGTTTTAVFTFYSTAGAATAPTASDVIRVGSCMAY